MSSLYNRIDELCKERGSNVTEMCRKSGAPRGSLTDLKMGRTNGLNSVTLSKIATYFGVTVDYLLGNEEKTVSQAGDGVEDSQLAEFMELFSRLSPEQQARELAYLRELVNNQDKPAAR